MTDEEVKILIDKLNISKLEERDEQEVAGYFETLDTIAESYRDIEITEGNLKNLHKILMGRSEKDAWHRGNYKQVSNAVEASYTDGTKQIVFRTTEPGFPTEEAMKNLIEWYRADKETLPIVKTALFVYDFLSIHPFQDGNGRLSRLLGTLLLLQQGYSWIQYVSFEHEIETRKTDYYKVLMQTQKQRPGEHVGEWLTFFLDCLLKIQQQLTDKLSTLAYTAPQLPPREKNILAFIENRPGSKSGEIAEKLNIPLPSVKKILAAMVENKLIFKYGVGAGTNYVAETKSPLKTGLMFQLTNDNRKKEFLLMRPDSFVEIKKILLRPLFHWTEPNQWKMKLGNQGLYFKVTRRLNSGGTFESSFALRTLVSPLHYEPFITLSNPLDYPLDLIDRGNPNSYPLKIEIELLGSVPKFDFDVMFVYDEA